MKHFGDITKINGYEVPIVDVITGGSPCQDLSVAGKREGLDGERSGLFMEQIRIIREMRDNDRKRTGRTDEFLRPRFMVWENVEGVFSSNNGDDFRTVLEETIRIVERDAVVPRLPDGQSWNHSGAVMGDRWSVAWRLFDGQFWGKSVVNDRGEVVKRGTPQRRRRLCLVADFGGQSAPPILFECASLSRDFEQVGETGQGITADSQGRVDGTNYTLKVRGGTEIDSRGKKAGKGALIQKELSGTLSVSDPQTLIRVYGMSPMSSNSMMSDNPNSGIYEADTSRTLDNNGGNPACNQGGMIVLGIDRAAFNQGENAKYDFSVENDVAQPIVARGAGGVMTARSEHCKQETIRE